MAHDDTVAKLAREADDAVTRQRAVVLAGKLSGPINQVLDQDSVPADRLCVALAILIADLLRDMDPTTREEGIASLSLIIASLARRP